MNCGGGGGGEEGEDANEDGGERFGGDSPLSIPRSAVFWNLANPAKTSRAETEAEEFESVRETE